MVGRRFSAFFLALTPDSSNIAEISLGHDIKKQADAWHFLPPLLFSLACAFLCGCASTPPPPPPLPVIPTRHVNGSQPIGFQRMICNVPAGTLIGRFYAGPFKTPRINFLQRAGVVPDAPLLAREFNDELRESGFTVVGAEAALFEEDKALKARFQLGGTILSWTTDVYDRYAGNYAECTADVEWELYDSFAKKVVLVYTASGHSRLQLPAPDFVAQALRNSLRTLIARSDLAGLVAVTNSEIARPVYASPLDISVVKPARRLSLPEDMDKVLEGVVVIRSGATVASGVIVSPDGYILTAAHVVEGTREVAVVLKSGLQLTASVERIDSVDDIALIKVPGAGHHALELNLGEPPPPGGDLFAVGAPSGEQLSFSVTKGVVSGVRELPGTGSKFLQTDASVNSGNSGGPFLDKTGKVIGICSWKIVRPGFEGLSFGVPIEGVAKELQITWKQP